MSGVRTRRLFDQIKFTRARSKARSTPLYLAARDPRTSRPAKVIIAIVIAYGLSPIDLSRHFIPVLGILDDVCLLPFGIYLALRFIPAAVLTDARHAAQQASGNLAANLVAARVIIRL